MTATLAPAFDPDQAYADMRAAMRDDQRAAARELADSLRKHIVLGGRPPHGHAGDVADAIFSAVAPDCPVCGAQTYLWGGNWLCDSH